MKIICTDNFSRDYVDDSLVCENISEYHGKLIVELLNERGQGQSQDYYMLVNDDYKLYKFKI